MTAVRRMALRGFLLALLPLYACVSPSTAPPSVTLSPSSVASPAPIACGTEQVTQLVSAFIEAFNAGNDPARLFAPSPEPGVSEQIRFTSRFQWYAANGGGLPTVTVAERKDLAAYFARRHAANEHITLLSLTTLHTERYPRADVGLLVTRTAADLGPLGDVDVKTAINCRDQTILVWVT